MSVDGMDGVNRIDWLSVCGVYRVSLDEGMGLIGYTWVSVGGTGRAN
jgi:hypothetical protein